MTWTDPTTRATGDLITAAIWNAEMVDNTVFLHDRVVSALIPPIAATGSGANITSNGDFPVASLNNVNSSAAAFFGFAVPDDFDALVEMCVIFVSSATTTLEYDLHSDYGALGEAYSNHSESALNQLKAATANVLTSIDVSGVFSSLAAGDFCGLKFITSTGANAANWNLIGVMLRYTRS
jgi:hypothetical protein